MMKKLEKLQEGDDDSVQADFLSLSQKNDVELTSLRLPFRLLRSLHSCIHDVSLTSFFWLSLKKSALLLLLLSLRCHVERYIKRDP